MTVYQSLDRECYVHITHHPRAKTFFATCYIKVKAGLLYTITHHQAQPLIGELVDQTVQRGALSKRKYLMGQPADGTITAPVFHLFDQYCRSRGLSSLDLYSKVFPLHGLTDYDKDYALWLAEWQGVELVLDWNTSMVKLLQDALSDAYLHPLCSVLEETTTKKLILQPS